MTNTQLPAIIEGGRLQPDASPPIPPDGRDYCVFLVAGEHSGDALGGKLMAALRARLKGRVRFLGVGGEDMEREGLVSLFPLADVAVMGPMSILPRLPRIARRVFGTVHAVTAARPDILVIIDSPEFTHPIAKRARRRLPGMPIVDYVSPTVWAWRPGRARKMAPYVDHVLALLPFEPEAHARLGGPPCSYVGHPLIERLAWLQALDPRPLADRLGLDPSRPIIVVLPGSRISEISRLTRPFGEAIRALAANWPAPQVIIPAAAGMSRAIEGELAGWPARPQLVTGEEDKFRAFKLAHAALAASGTVTLELALAGVPAVVAYKVDGLAAKLRFLMKVPSIVLANLVLGENVYPEFIQEACTGENLAGALDPLLRDSPERALQIERLSRVPGKLTLPAATPSAAAAEVVVTYLREGREEDGAPPRWTTGSGQGSLRAAGALERP